MKLIIGNGYNRSGELVTKNKHRLPEILMLLAFPKQRLWYPITGMYGGYGIRLEAKDTLVAELGKDAKNAENLFDGDVKFGLICDSFVRVWGGSEQDHFVTKNGFFSRLQEYY
jgi:hypothetical protein